MSSPSASISSVIQLTTQQLFDALSNEERATVVTPNRRLAAYLKDQFDALQLESGLATWATPDILPITTFLERSYRAASLRSESNAPPVSRINTFEWIERFQQTEVCVIPTSHGIFG